VFLVVGALAAGIGTVAYATSALGGAELDAIDARFEIRGEQGVPKGIVVVEVDDRTFDKLDKQWPFPRSLHGELIDRLTELGARAIAYDVQFTEPTTPDEDNALIRSVDRAEGVVLATSEVDERGRSRVFGGESVVRQVGARTGSVSIRPDEDGVWRRFPYADQGLTSFSVATAEESGAGPVDPGEFGAGDAFIDYRGPTNTFTIESFSDVLRGRVSDPAAFEDAIIVIGASAPTLQDVHPTPYGTLMSGAEIQANAIFSVLDGIPLGETPAGLDVALIALLGFAAPLAGLRLRPEPAFGLAIVLGALYLVVAQLAFNAGAVLPVTYPLLALTIGAIGTLGLYYLLTAFERQRVRDTFARFVPGNVVDQVLERTGGGDVRLGGVRRESTVLFADLRGFTAFSESRSPAEVMEVLNDYLGEMTDAIMDHGGTLVAYMGDGIMAVFGAPIEQPDHADRALAAAREMLEVRLPAFNARLREAGRGDGFRIGIGLNSGAVMSGQVGSIRRMEYTALGDTTNTASRLEDMTKTTDEQLFVAEATRQSLQSAAGDLEPVGEFSVRGKEAGVKVWTLPGTQANR